MEQSTVVQPCLGYAAVQPVLLQRPSARRHRLLGCPASAGRRQSTSGPCRGHRRTLGGNCSQRSPAGLQGACGFRCPEQQSWPRKRVELLPASGRRLAPAVASAGDDRAPMRSRYAGRSENRHGSCSDPGLQHEELRPCLDQPARQQAQPTLQQTPLLLVHRLVAMSLDESDRRRLVTGCQAVFDRCPR